MRISILGINGYIGYSLALKWLKEGHEVSGVDNNCRSIRVIATGSDSLTPVDHFYDRMGYLYKNFNDFNPDGGFMDLHKSNYLSKYFSACRPDVIVHLAEQPSAPWSMRNISACINTQYENIVGTLNVLWSMHEACPDAHLIKLGTMGEYGTPDCNIPEGFIPSRCLSVSRPVGIDCPMKGLPFPKSPNSFYHLSKVHDSENIRFACKTWGLTCTDIMQGVVFGLNNFENEHELTRFDYDQYFGTVINRFCAQALIGHPLTVYGSGDQRRGFLPLKDSLQCIDIIARNPPEPTEYRVINQFESVYSIAALANLVIEATTDLHIEGSEVIHLPNPRTEAANHYYNPCNETLTKLGYIPTEDIQDELYKLVKQLMPYRNRVNQQVIMPTTTWA